MAGDACGRGVCQLGQVDVLDSTLLVPRDSGPQATETEACTVTMATQKCIAIIITSDKGGGTCFAHVCLSVCLLARLLKNACMDLNEMLHVNRCLDKDELINF